MYRQVENSSRLHLLQCKWSLELQIHNVCTRIQFNLYLYNGSESRIMSGCIFIKIKCHIKISSRSFISFSPLNDEKFWRYGLIKQCLQDIFSFRNLITHIVCRHYVHMTHIKFLQKTDQMISTGCDLIFLIYLDKYQLGFTLSYVRVSGSKTSHFFKAYHAFDDITLLG